MLKKIAIIGIWLVLVLSVVNAADDMPGLVATLIDQDENVITGQFVICEMRVGGQTTWDWDVTDTDGEVNFGAAGDIGIYIMITEFNGYVYNTTVAKNPGQRLYTWKLGVPHDPE